MSVLIWTTAGKAKMEDHQKRGSWNPKTGRGSTQVRGILSVNGEGNSCAEVLKLVDQFVQRRTGQYHLEGDNPSSVTGDQQHVYTMWMYNSEKRQRMTYQEVLRASKGWLDLIR